MHSIPGKALAAGISSGISRSEGSGIHTQRSKPGAFWDNNFPKKKKKPGREKTHLDAVPDWIYPEFQKWGEFFWTQNKKAQHKSCQEKRGSWFVFPGDPTKFQPTTSFHNPNWHFFIQPSIPGEKLGITNYSSSGYSRTGKNPPKFQYHLSII